MKIRLVSHASVIVDAADVVLWTDPWLFGKAFNDSWALMPEASWDPGWLRRITHLWISHEHPDHFHLPTLRGLPEEFRRRVIVLFQKNNSTKIFDQFRRLGYCNFKALPHRGRISLTETVRAYCYQEGQMNSCLGIRAGEQAVLNVNDAEIRRRDCVQIKRDFGAPDIVLNQFSLAGYGGFNDRGPRLSSVAKTILENVADNHQDLAAQVTIPFASFMYFCVEDNRYMNEYANTPRRTYEYLSARGFRCEVLYPGDVYEPGQAYDSGPALARYEQVFSSAMPYATPRRVEFSEIEAAFKSLSADLLKKYPRMLLRWLKPVTIEIPDLGKKVRISVPDETMVETEDSADLRVNSQPLWYAFRYPWGVQTLGVSARFTLFKNFRNWQMHRILSSMNNAELYLRPRYLVTRQTLAFAANRGRGLLVNSIARFRRMSQA